jgi:symplekin
MSSLRRNNNSRSDLDPADQLVVDDLPLSDDNLSVSDHDNDDDDNADHDHDTEVAEKEDPLLLAIDDLEGRVVTALDDVKLHPGIRTSEQSIHEELTTLLRPVLEVAAHTAPSIARTYGGGGGGTVVDVSVEDVYERVLSDLLLPVLLEMAQSDTSPAKRSVALEFFRLLWKECSKAGSWLDETTSGLQAGPYGPGGTTSSNNTALSMTPMIQATLKRRRQKRLVREGEILRYWVQASIACLQPGVFSNEESEGAVASRGILAASASLRPSLTHIAQRIKDADDRGANRLYAPVMKMVEGVLKKLFLSSPSESVLSACIKFLEIVILSCSYAPQDATALRRRGQNITGNLFSLDDLPAGHPIITRESLESIAEYAFTTLRGMTLMGGQVKMDQDNLLSDMMLSSDGTLPATQVISILKPAALAYLECESVLPANNVLDLSNLNRSNIEFDFLLGQKSYILTINAMAALASNRPVFFKEAAISLARRTIDPPVWQQQDVLTLQRSAILAITQALKASCLTLLRNSLSVTTQVHDCLCETLKQLDMEAQATKALNMARQANALKTAGRAARNRANMYYEWEAAEESGRHTKRQRETDDALAQMRAAKAARGLGHGIQLPTNMADAVELVFLNLQHLPTKAPAKSGKEKERKIQMTLEVLVDAILSNGATLTQEEGRWFERDGGSAFVLDLDKADQKFSLGSQYEQILDQLHEDTSDEDVHKRRKLFYSQCEAAAAAASYRIFASSSTHRSKSLANIGNQINARLAFTLKRVIPIGLQRQTSLQLACECIKDVGKLLDEKRMKALEAFVETYPLAAANLIVSATPCEDGKELTVVDCSMALRILNEALLQSTTLLEKDDSLCLYDICLDLYVASVVVAGRMTNDKPNDNSKRKAAARATADLYRDFNKLPRLTKEALVLVGALCDIDDISKKAMEASRKTSHESVAASAAIHAAKVAAEKRATTALLVLRDAAFQRDEESTRNAAVSCAVAIASGRLPSVASVQENALKLVMNLLYTKNTVLAECVVDAANAELRYFAGLAVASFESIQKANEVSEKDEKQRSNPLLPQSPEEKQLMDSMKQVTMLIMALCVRQPEMIGVLFEACSADKANSFSKTVRLSMSTLSWAAAAKHGAAAIAMQVASMCGVKETAMLLSFLENLAPSAGKHGTEDDIAEACFKIQETKVNDNGEKDPRYIIPVVSVMKRHVLVERLHEFVAADDQIFLAALVRMCDRQQRNALLFRDEPDEENPSLRGMTFCEQLVYLHQLDFTAAEIPQKRYLAAIKLCLEDDSVFTDRVVMSSLEYMSGRFLTQAEGLPLAFMRTVILTCTKHESLQSWIANVLLTRLVEGKIYEDPRQWEGWMRCAHMLEKSDDPSANSVEAIDKLPADQLIQYQRKWAGK